MTAQNSQGIQTLLDAEKEASKIVAKAREYRNQRIKDARGEASKELDELKAAKEKEFKEFEATHSGDSTASQSTLDAATASTVASIEASFTAQRATVVQQLLERVVEVAPVLHKNFVKA